MRGLLFGIVAAALALGSGVAVAQNWYDTIIPEKSYDFGTVARGSKVRHAFRIVNTTSNDVHITGWRTKCGCTDVKVGSRDILPGTQTSIEVTLDTAKFQGYKASGITLVFDRPQFVEVDLNVTSFIRGDVLLSPGSVDLGVVPRGTERSQVMTLSYQGGMSDWSITKLNTISDHISAELRELDRGPNGTVRYELKTTLNPSAPPGYFRDEVTLSTNDSTSPTIPVSVTASIQAALTVTPAVLNLGRLKPGETVEKVVVVRSSKPFRVTEASADTNEVTASNLVGEPKPLHTVKVKLTAPMQPGPFHTTLEIGTDLEGEPPARVPAFATIVR